MSFDDVKDDTREGEIVTFAAPTMTELRRSAETIRPVPEKRTARALVASVRERLDWTRLPGLRPRQEDTSSYGARIIRRIGFFVLLPTLVVGLYLFAFASNQYVAEAQFAVRGNVEPMENISLGQYTNLIQKHNSQDSFIVRDYINSQTLVEALEKSIGISKMFSRSEADFWARFDPTDPIEDLTKYWRKHVEAHIDSISGVIRLSVRAFTPEDALTIARAVVLRSEALINDISKRAQSDMVAQAEADAKVAQDRLRKAHLALQAFRNQWGVIDPIKSAEGTLTALTSLRKDKLKAENDLQVLRGSNLDERSRSIQTLVANIAAIDQQMKTLQDEMTSATAGAGGQNLTEALLQYEGLLVERTIAEKLEESAHTLLDRARVSASKQHIFLATFVPPVLPTDSLYPERGHTLLVAFFCFLVIWSSSALLLAGIRDQRM
ncbi:MULTISPECIES: capsule biosynthesis protein [Methylobacterium]|mgnify:CR=1 FL=1|jgi:capsular polysaccharide transport system permease protein|uniref:Lipopolysaccharide biosynthesis protein n=3 Tax=Methylobacterium TaxID=407 RepID=A0A089NZW4_9HYPH|nr:MULTISPECIES: capsule biosynthesis protein [Methylobacterium]KOX44149.1 capsule biosynthesis protein [Streptomyces purpurogeneiscleroticus]AIQ93511.1 Lipopolysaccharide biosynthesis protein [Methylobacterium oryzae CBMB20]MBA9061088.1 capsular polysaccharide transport system permease protein [Methylobacterium fujisawaense]MBP28160.1 capsule biosynthesis protein [Methylobacterium sp.]MDE4910463.1 capsule biosynthesis protein [Methylobacterium sp. 092160098-2]